MYPCTYDMLTVTSSSWLTPRYGTALDQVLTNIHFPLKFSLLYSVILSEQMSNKLLARFPSLEVYTLLNRDERVGRRSRSVQYGARAGTCTFPYGNGTACQFMYGLVNDINPFELI